MNILFDTNVLVSALAARGLCEALFETCLLSHQLVVCPTILEELERNLPRVLKGVTLARVREQVDFVRSQAWVVNPVEVPHDRCRDADDLAVLGALRVRGVDCLVTGDADLLILQEDMGKPILSPRQLRGRLV